MAAIRLITIFVVLGSITLLLLQNLSPSLPLTFLGMRSQSLPLAVWVLLSILAGAIASLTVSSLFRLNLGMQEQTRYSPSTGSKPFRSTPTRNRQTASTERFQTINTTNQKRVDENLDDWDLTGSEDWDFEDERVDDEPRPVGDRHRDKRDFPRDKRLEEDLTQDWEEEDLFVPDEPAKTQSPKKYDSTYSYSYHQPQQTGAGKTESIYDADYRVLVPPYYPESEEIEPEPAEDRDRDDDWDFLDDLDVEEPKKPQTKEGKNPENL